MELSSEYIAKICAQNEQLLADVAALKDQVKYLLKLLYAPKSEKYHPNQALFDFLEDGTQAEGQPFEGDIAEDEGTDKPESKRGKRKPLREKVREDLPREEVIIIPEEVQQNPEAWKRIGEEITEELDVTPARFFLRIIIRPKYVLIDDKTVPPVCAAAPDRLIPNSYASVGLVLYILIGKYCDHLPLYRQEQIFKRRFGVEISRKTMSGWLYLIANWLQSVYEALRTEILQQSYIQADETFVKFQDKTKKYCPNGYLWGFHAPQMGVLFEWHDNRSDTCLKGALDGFSGVLQTDGYAAYDSFLNHEENKQLKEGIERAACWAHARRKFHEALPSPFAEKILSKIRALYAVESMLRKHPELDRSTIRREESAPVLQQIKTALEEAQANFLPKNNLGKAIRYALNRWDELTTYVEYSEVEIDNNLIENAIRPTAIGKKNFLFFGSPTAGQTSAVIYSLVETCRKLDINPAEYMRDVLEALPTMTTVTAAQFTPAQWKARQPVVVTETA